jgi:enoyl-CoA hydratase
MEELQSHLEGGVLWLTLNRPQALNALSAGLVNALTEVLQKIAGDSEVRVVVLTGTGRAFCVGADLKESEKRGKESGGNLAFIKSVGFLTELFEACPKPIIAAVNGIAVAGGLELVLSCDLVIAAESAVLGDAHANYAMFPGGGATVRLPRRVGMNTAKYLMFTGESYPARDFLEFGLVNKVVPDTDLAATVSALAQRIAAKSPLVLARMKEALNDSIDQPASIALKRERELNHLHSLSFDRTEGLAAFREKRTPRFQGK